jgi:hypothetical protein
LERRHDHDHDTDHHARDYVVLFHLWTHEDFQGQREEHLPSLSPQESEGLAMDHNAAHIVHCVNTYPALLAALRECITEEGAYCLNHDSKALLRGRLASITLLAKQAIALAEGK